MAIVITCQCGASFRAKDDLAGKQVRCPKCQAPIAVAGGQGKPAGSQGPLSLDELMRLAATPSEAPQSAPTFRPPSQSALAASSRGDYDRGGYDRGEGNTSSGVSSLVIGLTIVASLLVVTAGVVAVVWIMRAAPPGPADVQVSQAQTAKTVEEPSPPPQMERVKATMDTVGTKGKDYGEGPIATPLSLRWRLADKIVLLEVQNALNLFWGFEGRYPATHEEFMQKVVKDNNLKLPELPPGQRYVYDPETHELMVEREAKAPAPKP
jgi:hypothetical protein